MNKLHIIRAFNILCAFSIFFFFLTLQVLHTLNMWSDKQWKLLFDLVGPLPLYQSSVFHHSYRQNFLKTQSPIVFKDYEFTKY